MQTLRTLGCWAHDKGRSHGGAGLPLPAQVVRLRAAVGGCRRVAGVLLVVALFLLVRFFNSNSTDGSHGVLRFASFKTRGDLPFGGIARRARGFASLSAALDSEAETVLLAHPDWHGILAATINIGDPVLEIPGVVDADHEERLVAALTAMPRLKQVVVHGVPPGTLRLAASLRAARPQLRVVFVFHGAPSNTFHVPAESDLLHDVMDAVQRGDVYKVGWVKNGLAALMGGMIGRPGASQTVWNFPGLPILIPDGRYSERDAAGRQHIGVLGVGVLMKNIVSQVLAACMLPNVVVHVTEIPGAAYLQRCASPVVAHGFMDKPVFLHVLSRMDVVMYASISECMPMVVMEGLALGVPVITSPTSLVYAADPELESALVVPYYDNPSVLQAYLLKALARRDELARRGRALLDWLHARAGLSWASFLERHAPADGAAPATGSVAARFGPAADADSPPTPVSVEVLDWRSAAGIIPKELPYLPYLPDAGAAVSPPPIGSKDKPSAGQLHVAVLTYELAPVTPGGAGVVIAALVLELLSAGHAVTVLAYMGCADAAGWAQGAREQAAAELSAGHAQTGAEIPPSDVPLRVVCVPKVLAEDPRARAELSSMVRFDYNLWLVRSREFAVAARLLYEESPFHVLEAFDYAGIAFELLRDRVRRLSSQEAAAADPAALPVVESPGSLLYDYCDVANGRGARAARGRGAYLPLHVTIAVRAHGTLQLIDQAEGAVAASYKRKAKAANAGVSVIGGGVASASSAGLDGLAVSFEDAFAPQDPQKVLMYRMEQFALAAADVVLAQSEAMRELYVRAYGLRLHEDRVVLAPPPMRRILAPLDELRKRSADALRQGGLLKGASSSGEQRLPLLLVYGKLQAIKGTVAVVEALAQVARMRSRSLPSFRVAFVGLDMPAHVGTGMMSTWVRETLGPLVAEDESAASGPLAGFDIVPPVPRDDVPAFLEGLIHEQALVAAILASELETFSMAIHELAYVGVPIIASSIPAYDAVGPRAPFRFMAGNSTQLAQAIRRALTDMSARMRAAALPPLPYPDAMQPYASMYREQADAQSRRHHRYLHLQVVDAAARLACEAAALSGAEA